MSDDARDEPLTPAPAPTAGFRGDLGRRLAEEGPPPGRPARLWLWVALCVLLGLVLLVIALVGA